MPCYDPRDDDDYFECRARLHRATRAACEMAKALADEFFELSAETQVWILEHNALDATRENA